MAFKSSGNYSKKLLLLTVPVVCCVYFLYRWYYSQYDVTQQMLVDVNGQSLLVLADCKVTDILCGMADKVPTDSNTAESLKGIFHRAMSTVHKDVCTTMKHFGEAGDGGYDVCISPTVVAPHKCLVYSFGINNDWTFDEDMSRYGCEVHSFDPSIGQPDHIHEPNVHFHNLGLWGTDFVNAKNWTLLQLSTIRKQLGHQQRVIDVLKIDIEGAEWPFLRNVLLTEGGSQLATIKQLLLELHTPRFNPDKLSASDLAEIVYYVQQLDRLGFRVYRNVQRNWCCTRFSPLMPAGVSEKCCHETFYVNTRL